MYTECLDYEVKIFENWNKWRITNIFVKYSKYIFAECSTFFNMSVGNLRELGGSPSSWNV